VQKILVNLPQLVSLRLESKGMEGALASGDNRMYADTL